MEITAETLLTEMKHKSELYGVELTENAPKIAKARAMMKCYLDKCICDPKDSKRYCISTKCMEEIQETGICHCRAFRKNNNL